MDSIYRCTEFGNAEERSVNLVSSFIGLDIWPNHQQSSLFCQLYFRSKVGFPFWKLVAPDSLDHRKQQRRTPPENQQARHCLKRTQHSPLAR